MEKLIKEILEDEKFKSYLMERMADIVSREYHFTDAEGLMIKHEIRKVVADEAKDVVKDYTENYYEGSTIKELIENEVKRLSKEQIIELLKGKI